MGLASINIKFSADLAQFSSEIQNSARKIKKLGADLQTIGAGLSIGLTAPILAFGVASVNAFDDSAKGIAQVDAALKSTGGTVGFTSKQLQEMAAELQNVTTFDDDTILKQATANLLTFNKVTGSTFVAAQKAALDLATRLDGDLQTATLQVGKALQDPVKGITALSKAGVSFSAEQKATIKAMVATNNVAGAQSLILKELNKEFGGSAEAAAKAGTGSFKQLANQVNDLQEDFGKIIAEGLQPFVGWIKSMVSSLQSLSPEAKQTIVVIGGIIAVLGPAILAFGTIVTLVPSFVAGLSAISGAFTSLTAVIAANPIGTIAIALGAIISYAVIANSRFTALTNSTKEFNDINLKAAESISKESSEMNSNLAIAKNHNLSKEVRSQAIKKLNALSPEYLGNLTLENIYTQKATDAVGRYNDAMLKKAKVQAAEEKLVDVQKKLLDLQLGNLAAVQPSVWQNFSNALLSSGNSAVFAARTTKTVSENLGTEYSELTKLQSKLASFIGTNKDYKNSNDAVNSSLDDTLIKQNELKIGTIAYYESLIAGAKKLQNEVALNGKEFDALQVKIDAYQKKIDAISKAPVILPKPALPDLSNEAVVTPSFSLEELKAQQDYYEKLRDRFSKTSDDYKYYSDQVNNTKIKIAEIEGTDQLDTTIKDTEVKLDDFTKSISDAFTSAVTSFAEGFAEIIGSFASGGASLANIGNLVFGTLANLAIQVGKIAIATGIAVLGIKKALQSLNPAVAIAAGIALVALGTIVKGQLQSAGSFKDGGIVGGTSFHGDKLWARVNSGEMILNNKQQRALYGNLTSGSDQPIVLSGDWELAGDKLRLVLDRTDKKNSRFGK